MTHTTQTSLMPYNTMRLACIADTFITVTDESQVKDIFSRSQSSQSPTFILSGGSNVILPTELHATVIHPELTGIEVLSETDSHVDIEVMGGENWHKLVTTSVGNGWYGLENLALIPGLVGASPVQNIGAYGVQLEDCLTHVKAFHIPSLSWHTFSNESCEFDYRDSKFKRDAGQWLITRVGFRLHKDSQKVHANYGDVSTLALSLAQRQSRTSISPVDVMNAIIEIRQSKLPDPEQLPNCGSFFKNPIIDNEQFATLQAAHPSIVGYPVDHSTTKVAAGWLIDNAGLKGKGIEPILTHTKQALVLVNHSTNNASSPATQTDILATQQFIQQRIYDRFQIALEREPVWVDSKASYTDNNRVG